MIFNLPRDCDICQRRLLLSERLRYRKEGTVYCGRTTAGEWREFEVRALCRGCRVCSRRNRRRSQAGSGDAR